MISAVPSGLGTILAITPNVETLGYCRVIPPGSRKSKFKIKGKEQGWKRNLQTVRTDSLPNGLRLPNVLPPH